MPTPFPQTLRVLKADRHISSLAAAAFTLLVILLWGYWFLNASIRRYRQSETVISVVDAGAETGFSRRGGRPVYQQIRRLTALFPAEAADSIAPGQRALLRLSNSAAGTRTEPDYATGHVVETRRSEGKGPVIVILEYRVPLGPKAEARPNGVRIVVSAIPPARFFMQTLGFQSPSKKPSPQSDPGA